MQAYLCCQRTSYRPNLSENWLSAIWYAHDMSSYHFLAPHHIVQYLQVYAGTAGHLVDIWQWTSATSDVNVRLRKMNVLMLLVTLRCSICLLFYNTQTNYKYSNSVQQKLLILRVIRKWTVQSHTKKKKNLPGAYICDKNTSMHWQQQLILFP